LVRALPQLVPGLLERHRVCAVVARLEARERAKQTTGDADVGRLEPDVVVVEGARAVTFLALTVREPSDGQQIGALEEPDAVGEIEPDTGRKLVRDVSEAGSGETGGPQDIAAAQVMPKI